MNNRPTSPALRLLQPVRKLVDAFFKYDVELKRGSKGVHIVLQEQPAKPAKPLTREQEAARRDKAELAQMLQQLGELLDELPETRKTMRHLVFVEHAITKHRLKALHKLPVDVLEKALAQLEGLVTNWSPVGLASLRSKMAVAIIDREHRLPDVDAPNTSQPVDTLPLPVVTDEQQAADENADSEDAALAAAYAALGLSSPAASALATLPMPLHELPGTSRDDDGVTVELQGELGSRTPRPIERDLSRPSPLGPPETNIDLRTLRS